MARQGRDGAARRVEQVRKRIERWRSSRNGRSPMPAGLWDEASSLARDFGVHRVKSALGLNYESLKRRVEGGGAEGGGAAKAGFIELRGTQLLEPAMGPVVEVAAADGGRLTVRLATGSELDVSGLVEAFCRRQA